MRERKNKWELRKSYDIKWSLSKYYNKGCADEVECITKSTSGPAGWSCNKYYYQEIWLRVNHYSATHVLQNGNNYLLPEGISQSLTM